MVDGLVVYKKGICIGELEVRWMGEMGRRIDSSTCGVRRAARRGRQVG